MSSKTSSDVILGAIAKPQWWFFGWVAALGVAVLMLALPRTLGSWQALDAQGALDKIGARSLVTDADLGLGAAGLKAALEWVDFDPWLRDLALIETTQAQRFWSDDPRRAELLSSASAHLIRALAIDPLDVMAWMRLADVRELARAPRRDVAVALMGALDAAPFDRGVWLGRSSQMLGYLDVLTPEERAAFEGNIRTVWAGDQNLVRHLAEFAISVRKLDFIAATLGSEPDVDKMIKRVQSEARPIPPPK